MSIPLNILFWGFAIAYSIHIVEESTVGGGFIHMVKKYFWPEYNGMKFFGFNTLLFVVFCTGVILYEVYDGAWVLYPLSVAFLFATNGIWHFLQTILLKDYSPGLITSPIYWILLYFIIRYHYLSGQISTTHFLISAAAGTLLTLTMFASLFFFKKKQKSKDVI